MIFLYIKKKSGKEMPLRKDAPHRHSGVGRNLCQRPEILTFVRMTEL
jgi:hypothetical protein